MSETVLIFGVRNLGKTIAQHFGQKGFRVLCAARTPADTEAAAALATRAGGHGVAITCDLTDRASLEKLRGEAIDLCIASQAAGGRFGAKPLLDIDDDELARGLEVSVRGSWNLMKTVGAGMVDRGHGTLLQMGTSSGVRAKEGFAALGAVQHGLRGLVQAAAKEWRSKGVHVAYLTLDGPIESERLKAANLPASALLDPLEIARTCDFLHRQSPRAWTHELVLRTSSSDWTLPT